MKTKAKINRLKKENKNSERRLLASVGVRDEVSAWASLICSIAIALVTCGIQIWRMIRDRNSDKEEKKKDENENDEKENDEE